MEGDERELNEMKKRKIEDEDEPAEMKKRKVEDAPADQEEVDWRYEFLGNTTSRDGDAKENHIRLALKFELQRDKLLEERRFKEAKFMCEQSMRLRSRYERDDDYNISLLLYGATLLQRAVLDDYDSEDESNKVYEDDRVCAVNLIQRGRKSVVGQSPSPELTNALRTTGNALFDTIHPSLAAGVFQDLIANLIPICVENCCCIVHAYYKLSFCLLKCKMNEEAFVACQLGFEHCDARQEYIRNKSDSEYSCVEDEPTMLDTLRTKLIDMMAGIFTLLTYNEKVFYERCERLAARMSFPLKPSVVPNVVPSVVPSLGFDLTHDATNAVFLGVGCKERKKLGIGYYADKVGNVVTTLSSSVHLTLRLRGLTDPSRFDSLSERGMGAQ